MRTYIVALTIAFAGCAHHETPPVKTAMTAARVGIGSYQGAQKLARKRVEDEKMIEKAKSRLKKDPITKDQIMADARIDPNDQVETMVEKRLKDHENGVEPPVDQKTGAAVVDASLEDWAIAGGAALLYGVLLTGVGTKRRKKEPENGSK